MEDIVDTVKIGDGCAKPLTTMDWGLGVGGLGLDSHRDCAIAAGGIDSISWKAPAANTCFATTKD